MHDYIKLTPLVLNSPRTWFFAVCGFLTLIVTIVFLLSTRPFPLTDYDYINYAEKNQKNFGNVQNIYREILTLKQIDSYNDVSESSQNIQDDTLRLVCYYIIPDNMTRYKPLPAVSVDPYLCTHVIVGFATVLNATIHPQSSTDMQVYRDIVGLKNINPSLKILISIQDFTTAGELGRTVSSDELRTKFVINTLTFLNKTGFDGVDLDWEFPSWPNADLMQTRNFTLLLGKFRKLINHGDNNFILSVAVAAPEMIMRQSYEIDEMARHVDFVNLMSYDYHIFSEYLPLTGPNSPLYPRNSDIGYMETLNINWSATHWILWGMPLAKINIGIPTYGHSFRLINEDNNGWNAPAAGFGTTGGGDGFLTYPEACQFVRDKSATHVFDDEYDVPYAFNRKEWISYENPISIELKARYVKDNRYGGAMIYSLNCDDFNGVCSSQKFSLTRIVSNILTS